jgi:hypothetical protein
MIEVTLRIKNSPAFLTYEKKPVVFLNGTFDFYPGWSVEEKQYLARSVVEFYKQKYECSEEAAMEKISENWGKEIASLEDMIFYFYPKSTRAFYNPQDNIEQDWSNGLNYGWEQFWEDIQSEIEREQGDVFWLSNYGGLWQPIIEEDTVDVLGQIFDSTYLRSSYIIQSPAFDSDQVLGYWENRIRSLSNLGDEYKAPIIASTMPSHSEQGVGSEGSIEIPVKTGMRLSYDLFWEIALDSHPNIVLIDSWNNYYESSCIEPTVEFGDLFLERTEYWSSMFKAPIPLR